MDQLRKDGWYINESQTAKLFDDEILPKSSNEILKEILNEDLRKFAEPSIVNLTRKDENVLEGPCVLQLVRYRNVSVPRIKEEMNQADPAHSIIRLFLTDGHTSTSALILENIPGINADTPPGTKILLLGKVSVDGMFLILTKKDVKILGGSVGEMIEKWRLERNSVRAEGYSARSAAGKGTGAPKWVSFMKRNEKNIKLDKDFKANSVMATNTKEGEEDDDFKKNREQVLKEIGGDVGKKFEKPNIDRPVPKEKVVPIPKEPKEPKPRKEFKRRGRKNSEDGPDVDVGEYANHRPSGPATLFDFIGGAAPEAAAKDAVGKLADQTSRMQVSGGSERPQKSFERGTGGSRGGPRNDYGKGRGGSGAANPRRQENDRPQYGGPVGRGNTDSRPPRNDARSAKNSNFERKDDHQNAPKYENPRKPSNQQGADARAKTGPPASQSSGKYNKNDRPNTGPPAPGAGRFNQNDHQGSGSSQPQGRFNQNDRSNNARQQPYGKFNQNDHQGAAPFHAQPQGRFNQSDRPNNSRQQPVGTFNQSDHQGSGPFHAQPQGRYNQNDRSNNARPPPSGRFNQRENQNQAPQENAPTFQRNAPTGPRGNAQRNDFQKGPPRGNQNRQAAPGPSFNRNDFPTAHSSSAGPQWRVGSQCLATWTDGNLYPATVTSIFPDGNCVVRYNEYGNTQTIPIDFLIVA